MHPKSSYGSPRAAIWVTSHIMMVGDTTHYLVGSQIANLIITGGKLIKFSMCLIFFNYLLFLMEKPI